MPPQRGCVKCNVVKAANKNTIETPLHVSIVTRVTIATSRPVMAVVGVGVFKLCFFFVCFFYMFCFVYVLIHFHGSFSYVRCVYVLYHMMLYLVPLLIFVISKVERDKKMKVKS